MFGMGPNEFLVNILSLIILALTAGFAIYFVFLMGREVYRFFNGGKKNEKTLEKAIEDDDTLELSKEEVQPVNTGHHKMLRIALGHRAIEPEEEEVEELSLKDLIREPTLTYRVSNPRRRRIPIHG